MSSRLLALSVAGMWMVAGCCHSPVVAAGAGQGFFALDPHVVASPPVTWPPPVATPASCDEIADFERAGVEHTACPALQSAPVPAIGDADAPIASGSSNITCYQADRLMIVVTYTQQMGPKVCRHVTAMAVLPAKGK